MKLAKLLAIGACAAFALTTTPAFAAEKDKDKHGEHGKGGHAAKVPDTAEGIVAEIHKHHGETAELVKAKNLKAVHPHSDAITELAKALPAKVAADKKAAVESVTKGVIKAADDLHKAADGGDQAKSEGHLKKLDGALAQLDAKLK